MKVTRIAVMLAGRGQSDEAHHKAWLIDQIARIVFGREYGGFVSAYSRGGAYDEWDAGIAP